MQFSNHELKFQSNIYYRCMFKKIGNDDTMAEDLDYLCDDLSYPDLLILAYLRHSLRDHRFKRLLKLLRGLNLHLDYLALCLS